MNKQDNTIKKAIILLILMAPSMIWSGFVIRYGWNQFISTIDGVPNITMVQAIAIDVLVSYLVASNKNDNTELDYAKVAAKIIIQPLITLLLFWALTLFM